MFPLWWICFVLTCLPDKKFLPLLTIFKPFPSPSHKFYRMLWIIGRKENNYTVFVTKYVKMKGARNDLHKFWICNKGPAITLCRKLPVFFIISIYLLKVSYSKGLGSQVHLVCVSHFFSHLMDAFASGTKSTEMQEVALFFIHRHFSM